MTASGEFHSHIRTPLELDLAFRALERTLDHSSSPLRQFGQVTDFLSSIVNLPREWLTSYASEILPRALLVIGHSYVTGGDPRRWRIFLRFLDNAQTYCWTQNSAALEEARETVLEKLIFAFACVTSYRDIHELLRERGFALQDISDQGWSTIMNAESVGADPLQLYCDEAVSQEEQTPLPLRAALRAWKQTRIEDEVGVVLLDIEKGSSASTGTLLHLVLESRRATDTHVHFRGALPADNTETMRQLARCAKLSTDMVRRHFSTVPPPHEYTFSFHEHAATFSGESMGLAAALQLAVRMQRSFNRDVRWHLPSRMACIGGLLPDGTLQESSLDVLRRKIEIAFFSPVATVVLAATQSEDAYRIIRRLQQHYPSRQLLPIGVRTLEECAIAAPIIHPERRALSDRLSEFTSRHTVALLLSAFIIVAVVAGYFLWKYYYDYPDLEIATGTTVLTSSIVYNPRAQTPWSFRDGAERKDPVVPCGDLEVGDGYFRNFYIWNFSRFVLDVDCAIEGPDADQWYTNWNGGLQSIRSLDTLRIMVMYAPTRPGLENHAHLVLRDPDSGEELYNIELTGSAGTPQDAGYALRLDGNDDMLLFGERSFAFGMEDATIEMWLRPQKMSGCFFSNIKNPPDGQAIENMSLGLSADTLSIHVGSYRQTLFLTTESGAVPGNWMHFALAYQMPDGKNPGRITVMINGKVLHDVAEEFIIEDINQSYVTIGAYNDGTQAGGHFRGDVDELRLWRGFRSPEQIRAAMHRRVPGDTAFLRGYWNFDFLGEESAFVAYKRAQEGTPVGRPERARSTAPIAPSKQADLKLVDGPHGQRVVELQPYRYLHFARQLFASDSARSYALWYRNDGEAHGRDILALTNQDASLVVRAGEVHVLGVLDQMKIASAPGWQHVLLRIDSEQRVEVFLNGRYVGEEKTRDFSRGPFYRYVGVQMGGINDGYNHLTTSYYDRMRPTFRAPLAVADFCVWNRRLTAKEIAALQKGNIAEEGLLARWPMDALPDAMRNLTDMTHGYPMHVQRLCGWQ